MAKFQHFFCLIFASFLFLFVSVLHLIRILHVSVPFGAFSIWANNKEKVFAIFILLTQDHLSFHQFFGRSRSVLQKYAPNYTLYRETCFIHLVGRRLATVRAPNASIFCIPRLIWSSGLEIAIFVPKYIAYIVVCCVCVVLMLITSPTARASSQQQIQQTITQHKT